MIVNPNKQVCCHKISHKVVVLNTKIDCNVNVVTFNYTLKIFEKRLGFSYPIFFQQDPFCVIEKCVG